MTTTVSVEKSISNVQMSLQIIDAHLQSVSIENCLSNPDISSLEKAKLNVSLGTLSWYTFHSLTSVFQHHSVRFEWITIHIPEDTRSFA